MQKSSYDKIHERYVKAGMIAYAREIIAKMDKDLLNGTLDKLAIEQGVAAVVKTLEELRDYTQDQDRLE